MGFMSRMSDLRRRWAENLRAARVAAGLTQAELAEAAGTMQQRISACEKARAVPPDDLRLELARVLGCTVYDLFPYPDQEHNGGEGAAA